MSKGMIVDGKCASCIHFQYESEGAKTGFCRGKMKYKGRIYRSYHCSGYRKASPTNYDRIDIAVETLAAFLAQLCKNGPTIATGGTHFRYGGVSVAEWCDWLRQEAKE